MSDSSEYRRRSSRLKDEHIDYAAIHSGRVPKYINPESLDFSHFLEGTIEAERRSLGLQTRNKRQRIDEGDLEHLSQNSTSSGNDLDQDEYSEFHELMKLSELPEAFYDDDDPFLGRFIYC